MFITYRPLFVLALGIVPIVMWPHVWVAFAWMGVVMVLIALDVVLAPATKVIATSRAELPAVRRDTELDLPLEVRNTGSRRVHGRVRDAWVPSTGVPRGEGRFTFRLAPGEGISVSSPAQPFRRGNLPNNHVCVRTFGPLALAGRSRIRPGIGVLPVLPPFTSRKHLPGLLKRLKWVEGQVATRLRGQGTEFDSLRDYVRGDDVRSIDWRATARHGDLVVRVWKPEQDRRILVVIDTSRLSAVRIGDEPRLDSSLDTTLLLSAVAMAAKDRVDVVALDAHVRASAEGVGRGVNLHQLMRILAPVEPTLLEMDWERAASEINRRCRQHAMVVVLTAVDGGAMHTPMARVVSMLSRRHTVVVGAVQDAELTELSRARGDEADVFAVAAAHRELADGHALAAELSRAGITCVTGTADELPKAVVDKYLDLKLLGQL